MKCPQRQTTADFLTSLTNPAEREPLPGYEDKVPRTAQEFETFWKNSPEYAELTKEIDEYFVVNDPTPGKLIVNLMLPNNPTIQDLLPHIQFHFSCKLDMLLLETFFDER